MARVGYVLKRFPRVSETFIAQEILELERRGTDVRIYRLNRDGPLARHAWLSALRAPVTDCPPDRFAELWAGLRLRSGEGPRRRRGVRRALGAALDHPAGKGWRYLAEALAVARAAEADGVEHLHAHFANHPAFVTYAAHLLSGIPFSFTAHAKDIYSGAAPPPALWRRQVRRAAFAVTVTEANRLHLARILGPEVGAKVRRLYNGVDLESIRPAAGGGEAVGLLCVARLVEKKGVDLLLEALSILRDRGREVPCDIIGDGPLAGKLRERSAAGRLEDSVRFHGSLPHEEVAARMRRARAVVLPCRVAADGDRDALPTVLLEAMAAGVACISTPVGGVPEIIEAEATGLLVPPEDPAALAGALWRLASSPELAGEMGRRGRRRAEKLFDRRRNVARLEEWFRAGGGSRQEARDRTRESPDAHRVSV